MEILSRILSTFAKVFYVNYVLFVLRNLVCNHVPNCGASTRDGKSIEDTSDEQDCEYFSILCLTLCQEKYISFYTFFKTFVVCIH